MSPTETAAGSEVDAITIRRVEDSERDEVARLAARDSRPVPGSPLLGIESAGSLLAVSSLATGATVADPFRPSAEARAILELRVSQLRRAAGRGVRLPRPRRRPRARLAPPGSAGGRVLGLGAER